MSTRPTGCLPSACPAEPLSELVLRPGHVTVGRADHHAVQLDGQRLKRDLRCDQQLAFH